MIETFDNPAHALLLYIADELSPEDRGRLERQLVADPALAAQLHELQAATTRIHEGLARLDEMQAVPVSADTAARRVGREFRRQLATPRPAAPAHEAPAASRLRHWAYVATAAAAVLGIVFGIWAFHPADPGRLADNRPAPSDLRSAESRPADENLALLESSITSSATALADATRGSRKDQRRGDDVSEYLLNLTSSQQ